MRLRAWPLVAALNRTDNDHPPSSTRLRTVLTWVRAQLNDLLRRGDVELADLDQLCSGLAESAEQVATAARRRRIEQEWD